MSSTSESLADLHSRLGATLAPYRGVPAPAGYGDEAGEREALRSACGLLDRPWTSGLEMLGEDRARFLGGYVTCEVKDLASGDGVYGFVTSVKGRVLADLAVLALDDRLWLELPPGRAEEVSSHLAKYVIADRVEIRPLDVARFGLIGPRAGEVLGDDLPAEAWSHRPAGDLAAGARIVREPAFEVAGREVPAWTVVAPADIARACFETLEKRGAVPVGHRAYDALRVEAGRPLYGVDFDDGNFPQETGLEDRTVSYTKGCYLGQEVVARIHYRGGVNRHLRGLVFDHGAADPVGKAVLAGGRQAGTVTSAATVEGGGRVGLAILHQRAEPGAEVEIDGSGTARVVELPARSVSESSRTRS